MLVLLNAGLLIYVIFFKRKDDLASVFSLIVVANSIHSFFYENIKLRYINTSVSLALFILIYIFGHYYNFFLK